jgi:hypothetical protein
MLLSYLFFGLLLLIGLWAFACFASALLKSKSPGKLFKSWLKAVTGD